MMRRPCVLLLVCIFSALAPSPSRGEPDADETFFESRVRPILVTHCFDCHGGEVQESGLRLDSRGAMLAGGESRQPAIMPGDAQSSRLVAAVRGTGDLKMPPGEKLSDRQIETLVEWINRGARWPQTTASVSVQTMDERVREGRTTHWAFQPIRTPPLPAVKQTDWIATPIDAFVLARLEAAGLTPSSPADRRTLIRRATFDLWGLPPTVTEVEAFVHDDAPDAYEKLIDRLLASPRYGERWGRHWLDVARYADTRGYSFGRERQFPYAYTYRDYVIRSLNDDLPFDRFVLEQLAADRLNPPEGDPSLAAIGFLTVGRKFNNVYDDIDDQIDVVTRGLMGLTVACARCHDHKYDAIPTEDYYSLYGVFASCRQPDPLPLIGDPADTPGYAAFKQELDRRRQALAEFESAKHAELLDVSRSRVTDYLVRVVSDQPEELLQKLPFISLSREELKPKLVARWRRYLAEQQRRNDDPIFWPWFQLTSVTGPEFADTANSLTDQLANGGRQQINPLLKSALVAEKPQSRIDLARLYGKLFEDAYAAWKSAGANTEAVQKLSPAQQEFAVHLLDDDTPTAIPLGDIRDYLTRADRNKQRELEKKIDSHEAHAAGAPPRAMVLVDKPRPVEPRVFRRGDHTRPDQRVPRQFIEVLSRDDRKPFANGSGRLELAQAIVSPDNPLTARVIANRVWMHHFGEPLVSTPSDFGVRSDRPAHAELLDWLATELQGLGRDDSALKWSLKQLHRTILISNAYRQSSYDRPDCRTVDPENRLLWRMNRRRLEFEPLRDSLLAVAGRLDTKMGGKPVDLFDQPSRRRAIYGLIDRQELPNLLRTFDFASPDQSSARRPRTTVPQQALFMMNSPFVIEQATAIASRNELAAIQAPQDRVVTLYKMLFGRHPTDQEIAVGANFLTGTRNNPASLSGWNQYVQLLLMTNELLYID